MKSSELLIAAKAVIATPRTWTKGRNAVDVVGNNVPVQDRRAVCFCSFGALDKAGFIASGGDYGFWRRDSSIGAQVIDAEKFLRAAAKAIDPECAGPATVNDQTDHPTVMRMFDTAIELAKREEGTV